MTMATSITVRVPLKIRRRPGRKTVVTPAQEGTQVGSSKASLGLQTSSGPQGAGVTAQGLATQVPLWQASPQPPAQGMDQQVVSAVQVPARGPTLAHC